MSSGELPNEGTLSLGTFWCHSPVLLGVVHYGAHLELPVDLRPPKLLQLHLLQGAKQGSDPQPGSGNPKLPSLHPPSPARGCQSSWSSITLSKGREDAPRGAWARTQAQGPRKALELQHWHPRARLSSQSIFANLSPPPMSCFSGVSTIIKDFGSVK